MFVTGSNTRPGSILTFEYVGLQFLDVSANGSGAAADSNLVVELRQRGRNCLVVWHADATDRAARTRDADRREHCLVAADALGDRLHAEAGGVGHCRTDPMISTARTCQRRFECRRRLQPTSGEARYDANARIQSGRAACNPSRITGAIGQRPLSPNPDCLGDLSKPAAIKVHLPLEPKIAKGGLGSIARGGVGWKLPVSRRLGQPSARTTAVVR
jgi:hypothetical protein